MINSFLKKSKLNPNVKFYFTDENRKPNKLSIREVKRYLQTVLLLLCSMPYWCKLVLRNFNSKIVNILKSTAFFKSEKLKYS